MISIMNREQTEKLILNSYAGIAQDNPWEKYPEYTVFRHVENNKWFALIMRVKSSSLRLKKEGMVDIINLKAEPELVDDVKKMRWARPAYHMNKRHWVTVLLDGSVPMEKLVPLIELSYQLSLQEKPRTDTTDDEDRVDELD